MLTARQRSWQHSPATASTSILPESVRRGWRLFCHGKLGEKLRRNCKPVKPQWGYRNESRISHRKPKRQIADYCLKWKTICRASKIFKSGDWMGFGHAAPKTSPHRKGGGGLWRAGWTGKGPSGGFCWITLDRMDVVFSIWCWWFCALLHVWSRLRFVGLCKYQHCLRVFWFVVARYWKNVLKTGQFTFLQISGSWSNSVKPTVTIFKPGHDLPLGEATAEVRAEAQHRSLCIGRLMETTSGSRWLPM